VGQPDHPGHLGRRAQLDLVAGHGRAAGVAGHLGVDVELLQGLLEDALDLVQPARVDRAGVALAQQGGRRRGVGPARLGLEGHRHLDRVPGPGQVGRGDRGWRGLEGGGLLAFLGPDLARVPGGRGRLADLNLDGVVGVGLGRGLGPLAAAAPGRGLA
jgi:hypothetical protein